MRVPGCQTVDRQVAETLGEPLGETEMQLADRLRIGGGDVGERAAAEHELDHALLPAPGGPEAPAGHLVFHQVRGVIRAGQLGGPAVPLLPARLARAAPAAHGGLVLAAGLGAHLVSLAAHVTHRRRSGGLHLVFVATAAAWLAPGPGWRWPRRW